MIFGLENNPKNIFLLVITFLFMTISFLITIWNLCCSNSKNYMELNDVDNDEENEVQQNINNDGRLVFNEEFCIDSDDAEDMSIMDV